jgi:hypothetical protein
MFDPIHAIKTMDPRYRWRSAVTGKFVGRLFAALHPETTVKERVSLKDSGDVR